MPINLKRLTFDTSMSTRVRIFGSIMSYNVHYIKDSRTAVDKQVCPKSIREDAICHFCTRINRRRDPEVVSYTRHMCAVWDCNTKRWCCLSGSQGMFMAIRKILVNKKFSKEEIITGRTPDIVLQKIGNQTIPALIEESLETTQIPSPVPTQEDLSNYADRLITESIWTLPFDSAFGSASSGSPVRRTRTANADQELGQVDFSELYNLERTSSSTAESMGRLSPLRYYERNLIRQRKKITKKIQEEEEKPKFKPEMPQRNNDAWDII